MTQEEQPADRVEWHLIACGGDLTARVHGDMCLGETAAGELSFEPEDALLDLNVEGGRLRLTVLRNGLELAIPGEAPARTILVSPHTHVALMLPGNTLAIDNDFAHARPLGETLPVHLVAAGSEASGPLPEIPDASLFPRRPATARWRVPVALGAGLVATVAALLALSLLLPGWLLPPQAGLPETGLTDERTAAVLPPERIDGSAGVEAAGRPGEAADGAAPARSAAVSGDLLERLATLLSGETLPDASTLEFLVVTLQLLLVAYPDDGKLAEVSDTLTSRLLAEARLKFDAGDSAGADRLLETAAMIGVATDVVAETRQYLASTPAPAAASAGGEPEHRAAEPPPAGEASPAGEALPAATEEPSAPPGASLVMQVENAPVRGLDALIEQATGVPTGALSVQAPTLAGSAGTEETGADEAGANEAGAAEAGAGEPVAGEPGAGGTAAGEAGADARGSDLAQNVAPDSPPFYPLSDLNPVHREPLAYPAGAPEGSGGAVDVWFTVTETGEVADVVGEGQVDPLFIEAAEQTISRWRFEPVTVEENRIRVRSAIRVRYEG